MPLHWDEVKNGLRKKEFTIANAVSRTRTEGDLLKGALGEGIDMAQAIERREVNLIINESSNYQIIELSN